VCFLGFISEVEKRDLLRRAWGHVFPSSKEGWGIANIEASACGTPAIAADRPGLRDSVLDGQTGSLVPFGDAAALAAALTRLAADPALVERLGRAGRAFAETLSWERAAGETEQHITDTVRAARREP
jgi:glycosyltransferase involved in cell wall biosynthesis